MKRILNDWLLEKDIPKSPSGRYYMRDSRSIVGNACTWWALNSKGYTCDIRCAEIFLEEDAIKQQNSRGTDQPWPIEYIQAITTHHVDIQDLQNKSEKHHKLKEYGIEP